MPEPLDARERRELCDLFEDLGPDAPTLCEGWATLDLAAHLVVRERDVRAAPGILLGGPFHRLLEQGTERALARGYEDLVERVRNGPPVGPFAVPGLRTLINLNEYAVHHEDVRRANGLGPRTDRPDLQDALWKILKGMARLQLRKVRGARVVLARPSGEEVGVGRGPEVRVTGDPMELSLHLVGRREAAEVTVSGHPSAKDALAAANLSL